MRVALCVQLPGLDTRPNEYRICPKDPEQSENIPPISEVKRVADKGREDSRFEGVQFEVRSFEGQARADIHVWGNDPESVQRALRIIVGRLLSERVYDDVRGLSHEA